MAEIFLGDNKFTLEDGVNLQYINVTQDMYNKFAKYMSDNFKIMNDKKLFGKSAKCINWFKDNSDFPDFKVVSSILKYAGLQMFTDKKKKETISKGKRRAKRFITYTYK